MNYSIKAELKQHLINYINNSYTEDETDFEDLHHAAFNEDYYIIGYQEASEWLKSHNVDAFEAVDYVVEQMQEKFGEVSLKVENINSEYIINMLVYFSGYDVLPDVHLENTTKAELIAAIEENK